MNIKRKATKIALRWAIGAAVGIFVSWPVLLGLALLMLVVIILSSSGGPAALAPPALTATQVLSAAGSAYQSVPITLTRILQRDPAGHWGIGRPVTAS